MNEKTETLIIGFVVLAYLVGYLWIFPTDLKNHYLIDREVNSWQPLAGSELSALVKKDPAFSLGFDTPYSSLASGQPVGAPHSLFRMGTPNRYGFDLAKGRVAQYSLKALSPITLMLNVENLEVALNSQRPTGQFTEWALDPGQSVVIKSLDRSVKGSITVLTGRYDYVGYEGHIAKTVSVPAWSVKTTGYNGFPGQTVLIETAGVDSAMTLVVYNYNHAGRSVEAIDLNMSGFGFWKFQKPGQLVVRAADEGLSLNILPQN